MGWYHRKLTQIENRIHSKNIGRIFMKLVCPRFMIREIFSYSNFGKTLFFESILDRPTVFQF